MCGGKEWGAQLGAKGEGGVVVDEELYGRPHYERAGALADKWQEVLGVDDFTARILREGIKDKPSMTQWGKGEMPVIPQTPEEVEFGLKKVEEGIQSNARNWEEMDRHQVEMLKRRGYMIASSFVHWEGIDKERNKKREICTEL